MEKNIDIFNKTENCMVKSKLFYHNEDNYVKEIFIFCHGFCSGKGSNSVRTVANKLLEYNIPSISFDFPGHIDSIQGTDKLTVDVCISYIDSVIDYVRKTYGNDIKISFYAISFGAYILMNKLKEDNSNYNNIVLRSPAFNMSEIFVNCLLKESLNDFKKTKVAKSGHGGKIEVPYSFYEDLLKHNIYKSYNKSLKILVIQGDLDDTAPIKDTYKFIQNRPEIKLVEMKNMKHHMSPEEIEITTQKMIDILNINQLT